MSSLSIISRSHKVSFHTRRTRPLAMSPSQTTSLLPPIENGIDQAHQGEPSWFESYKWFFFSSYFNVLLVFVPLSVLAHHLHWDVSLRFGFSFLAIVPLAKVLSYQ
jgi:Ca2+:H+ antiporter